MFRVGLVGYGFAGRRFHSYLIDRVPELTLTAIVSRSDERRALAACEHGVSSYPTLGAMLEREQLDLVVIATPHDTHAALAIEALEAGCNVVVDKAMCLNGREADAMIESAARSRGFLSVFQNRRWDWDYLTVKQVLAEGLIGSPYLVEVSNLRYRSAGGWRGTIESGGGLLFDWGAHLIDQALQLISEPVVAINCDVQYRGWGRKIGSYARVGLRFASGLLYAIELGNLARVEKPRWVVLGDLGSLVKTGMDPQERAMLAGDIDAAAELPADRARVLTTAAGQPAELVLDSVRADWTSYYRNIADVLADRGTLLVPATEIRRVMAVFDAALASADSGKTEIVTI